MEEELFELNKWFTSLTVSQKERIATKIHRSVFTESGKTVYYPECTELWNEQTLETKRKIHDHCTDTHGYLLPEWREGNGMSY